MWELQPPTYKNISTRFCVDQGLGITQDVTVNSMRSWSVKRGSGALYLTFHSFLDVAVLCLRLAKILLNLALLFEFLITHEVTGNFLYLALYFVGFAFDLILVSAHVVLQIVCAGWLPTLQYRID